MADGADAFCRPDQPFFQTPFAKADVQNKAIEATNHYFTSVKGGQAARPEKHPTAYNIVQAKNETGDDLRRGDVVEFGDYVLDELDPYAFWFAGETPAATPRLAWGLARQPVKDTKIGDFLISGKAIAHVNVTDEDHTHARLKGGETTLQSSNWGPVRILYKPAGTGELECAVLIDPPPPRSAVQYETFITPSPVNNQTAYAPWSHIDYDTGGIASNSGNDITIECESTSLPFRISWAAFNSWDFQSATGTYQASLMIDSPNAPAMAQHFQHHLMPSSRTSTNLPNFYSSANGSTGSVSGSATLIIKLSKGHILQLRSDVIGAPTPQNHRCYARMLIEPMF